MKDLLKQALDEGQLTAGEADAQWRKLEARLAPPSRWRLGVGLAFAASAAAMLALLVRGPPPNPVSPADEHGTLVWVNGAGEPEAAAVEIDIEVKE
jgi:hypothetical protein